jgi:hypothetical protein
MNINICQVGKYAGRINFNHINMEFQKIATGMSIYICIFMLMEVF